MPTVAPSVLFAGNSPICLKHADRIGDAVCTHLAAVRDASAGRTVTPVTTAQAVKRVLRYAGALDASIVVVQARLHGGFAPLTSRFPVEADAVFITVDRRTDEVMIDAVRTTASKRARGAGAALITARLRKLGDQIGRAVEIEQD